MLMRDLYIDCDGVIYNTVKYAFEEMKKLGVNLKDEDAITDYFVHCDWNKLMTEGGIINDAQMNLELFKLQLIDVLLLKVLLKPKDLKN